MSIWYLIVKNLKPKTYINVIRDPSQQICSKWGLLGKKVSCEGWWGNRCPSKENSTQLPTREILCTYLWLTLTWHLREKGCCRVSQNGFASLEFAVQIQGVSQGISALSQFRLFWYLNPEWFPNIFVTVVAGKNLKSWMMWHNSLKVRSR